jgi:hypothetical protein
VPPARLEPGEHDRERDLAVFDLDSLSAQAGDLAREVDEPDRQKRLQARQRPPGQQFPFDRIALQRSLERHEKTPFLPGMPINLTTPARIRQVFR